MPIFWTTFRCFQEPVPLWAFNFFCFILFIFLVVCLVALVQILSYIKKNNNNNWLSFIPTSSTHTTWLSLFFPSFKVWTPRFRRSRSQWSFPWPILSTMRRWASSLPRASSCMVNLALARRCWLRLWLIRPAPPSSGSSAQSSYRSTWWGELFGVIKCTLLCLCLLSVYSNVTQLGDG